MTLVITTPCQRKFVIIGVTKMARAGTACANLEAETYTRQQKIWTLGSRICSIGDTDMVCVPETTEQQTHEGLWCLGNIDSPRSAIACIHFTQFPFSSLQR